MLKNQRNSGFAVIEQIFESAFARKRIAANYLSIIRVPFVQDLLMHGYARATIRLHVEVIEAMRRILIDKARRKRAHRHGGDHQRVDLEDIEVAGPGDDDQLLAVNDALDKLVAIHAVQAEVVKLRCFVGMTNAEAAQALGLTERTAKYYWTHARAWLIHEINPARAAG